MISLFPIVAVVLIKALKSVRIEGLCLKSPTF